MNYTCNTNYLKLHLVLQQTNKNQCAQVIQGSTMRYGGFEKTHAHCDGLNMN